MNIRKSSFKLAPAKQRHRKRITLNVKLDVLQRHESGIRPVDIGRAMGLPPTTVRSIIKESDKIKKFSKQDTPLNTVRLSARNGIMIEMERLLLSWIYYETEHGMRPTLVSIQEKARSIYEELKIHYSDISNIEPFRASRGWFERFKRRANLQNIVTVTSTSTDEMEASTSVDGIEATSTDSKEIISFHYNEIENLHMESNSNDITLKEIIEEGDYGPQQVFNVDETGLFWKRMPSTTYISREEFSSTSYNVSRDRLSLLLGSNATGDFKLKPLLVYHTETPRALKGYCKNKLSVIWRTNKEAWVTQSVFEDWFVSYFCPAVKYYCFEHNLPNKALLIIDNASGHPTALDDLSDNVKVIFLPANSNFLLQPMNQGIITTFKAYYHRKIFTQALKVVEPGCNTTIDEFWQNYDILKAIDNIFAAWNEITISCINRSWERLWPDCVQEFSGLDEPAEALYQNIVDIGKQIGLNDIQSQDIEDLIASHEEKLTTEELRTQEKQRAEEEREDNTDTEHPTKTFGLKSLGDALKHIEEAMAIFEQDDPDRQRSSMVNYAIDNAIHCYRELYREKKKSNMQLSLSSFFNTTIKSEPR